MNYRKPFGMIAITREEYEQKKATSLAKSDLCKVGVPYRI